MKIFIIAFIFFSNISVSSSSVCDIENPYLKSKVDIVDTPNYFFRTFPDTNSVSYNGDGTNYILNFDLETKTSIPGKYDPVPTWDERIITTPMGGFKFYDVNKLLVGELGVEPLIFTDSALAGVYQSIGSLNSDGSQIRVITDANGVTAKDYLIAYERDGSISINPMAPAKKICSEQAIKLPMISKDGMYLAGRDMNFSPPTSRIYKIENDGSCSLIKDLKIEVGKIDFSFDGNKIAFHKGVSGSETTDYARFPTWVQDVYVYNLLTDKTKKITNNSKNKTSYYPVWRRNGDIVYIDKAENDTYSFSIANPDQFSDIAVELSVEKDYLAVIGDVWVNTCVDVERQSDNDSILTALSMSNINCKKLIDDHWGAVETRAIAKGISKAQKSDFYSVCPSIVVDPPTLPPRPRPIDPIKVVQRKCNTCHGDSIKLLNTTPKSSSSKGGTWLDEALLRMNSQDETYRMPKGSSLSADEIREVTEYLEQFRQK